MTNQRRILLLTMGILLVAIPRAYATEDPADHDILPWLQRAHWYGANKQYAACEHVLQKLRAKYPHYYRPYRTSAWIYRTWGLYEQAARYFRKAKELRSDGWREDYQIAECYLYEGLALVHVGRWGAAIQSFQRGVEAKPDYWQNYHWMGRIYLYGGQYDRAIPCLEKARDCNPRNFNPRRDLAFCYQKLGKRELAKQEWQETLRYNPGALSAHYNLGLLYARNGLWKNAWREFHLAVSLGMSKEAFKPRTE